MGFFSSKRHGVYKNVNGKAVLVENNTETATNTEESTGDFATILPVGEPVALPKEKLDYLLKNGKVVPHEKLSEDATGAELLEDMLNTFSIKVEEKSAQKAKETLNDVFEKLEPVETVGEVITALKELDTTQKKNTLTKKPTPKKKVITTKKTTTKENT